MNKILSVFIINILFLINPSVGYSQLVKCSDIKSPVWFSCVGTVDVNELLLKYSPGGFFFFIEFALEAGADVNHQDKHGRTALMLATFRGGHRVIKALIEAGSDVNHQDKRGWTALMSASNYGNLEAVLLLLEFGADVNSRDNFIGPGALTALKLARMSGHLEIVKALLAAGATEL